MVDKNDNGYIAEFVVTVYLVNGRKISHIYEMIGSAQKQKELIRKLALKVTCLNPGHKGFLYFHNPLTFYNPDNVMCIEYSGITEKELKEIMGKSEFEFGLLKKGKGNK